MLASCRRFGKAQTLSRYITCCSLGIFLQQGGEIFQMLHNVTMDKEICQNVIIANSFIKRLKGLMFTKELSPDSAVYIHPCSQIHTFFMNYNIDVLYLDHNYKILAIDEKMKPGKIGKSVKGAVAVIELQGGRANETNMKVGQVIQITNEERRK